MRHLCLAVVVLVACDTADDPEFSRIDNQSSARLVLVDEQDWEVDDSHVWHVDCGAGWDEDVELRVKDDVLVLASTGDNDGDCEARVVATHLDSLTISGDGDLDGDGIPNYRDPDSDGDGVPDTTDRPSPKPSDGRGCVSLCPGEYRLLWFLVLVHVLILAVLVALLRRR